MNELYVSDVLRIAEGEIGYLEKATNAQLDDPTANAGSGNWTKYARDLYDAGFFNGPKNGYDWCTMLPDWCMLKACGDAQKVKDAQCYTGPYGAGCKMSVMYFREAGRFAPRETADPRPGDQIFFGTDAKSVHHTGLVYAVTADSIVTIEGNTQNAVRKKNYNRNNAEIYGYGRPKYDGDAAPGQTDKTILQLIAQKLREIAELLEQ